MRQRATRPTPLVGSRRLGIDVTAAAAKVKHAIDEREAVVGVAVALHFVASSASSAISTNRLSASSDRLSAGM